jgi:putative DNA methylase
LSTTADHFSPNGLNFPTFLESRLPYRELSLIAQADRRSNDPVYSSHRWWARRPPGVMRGLLLAAAYPASLPESDYWRMFASEEKSLLDLRVHDLFVGGGTTVVEAARLGAVPSGTDVDPLAIEIVKHELESPDPAALRAAAKALLSDLQRDVASLFRKRTKLWTPLHYFWVRQVECPKCGVLSILHRSLIIARNSRKSGSVIRNAELVVFCPDCLRVHLLDSLDRRQLRCCGRKNVLQGNFAAQKFTCEHCGTQSTHRQLSTGVAPARLLAVEETAEGEYRRIRQATKTDRDLLTSARQFLNENADRLKLPITDFDTVRRDSRPLSFGITKHSELFTARQLALFGRAFKWIQDSEFAGSVRRALMLAVSNALTTNNALCGYAVDYGRLAPLFSVRSYSLPALTVELNPFHPNAGRGTLMRSLEKVIRAGSVFPRRYVWSYETGKPIAKVINFAREPVATDRIICASAAEAPATNHLAEMDLCLFDPPYFDYIAYSELSEFYRSWLDQPTLGGTPLLPDRKAPVSSFSSLLSQCLISALARLRPGKPLAFTFHSNSRLAWDAIGTALDRAGLLVTALWPLKNDSHMGHHSKAGNCEWDVSVVCRRTADCVRAYCNQDISDWAKQVKPLRICKADRLSLALAIEMSGSRFGRVATSD